MDFDTLIQRSQEHDRFFEEIRDPAVRQAYLERVISRMRENGHTHVRLLTYEPFQDGDPTTPEFDAVLEDTWDDAGDYQWVSPEIAHGIFGLDRCHRILIYPDGSVDVEVTDFSQ